MKTAVSAIIPARAGSKGIKDKNIIDFCGKPLIAWSIEQALQSTAVEAVYVSTNGENIAETASKYGAKIIWRPEELSIDTASSESAVLHGILEIEKERKVDAVLFLQATSPIRDKEDIRRAVDTFKEEEVDSLFSMSILEDYCIWKKQEGELQSVSFDYRKRGRRQEREPFYLENGSIYIFKPDIIKQYGNRLGGKIGMYEMPFEHSYEIDNQRDIAICEYYMRILMKERTR